MLAPYGLHQRVGNCLPIYVASLRFDLALIVFELYSFKDKHPVKHETTHNPETSNI